MPRALPGAYNSYIPGADLSGKLFVDFSRNLDDFAVNKYAQPVATEQMVGIWFKMGLDERARIMDADLARYRWADGFDRPDYEVPEYFEELAFRCHRHTYVDRVGQQLKEQATWDEVERRSRSLAQKAMTARTIAVLDKMTDSAEYPTGHTADLSVPGAISGVTGNWAASTAARLAIKRTLNHIKKRILLDTRAAVNSDDLLIVMSPETAEQIAVTQEIVELVKQNIGALKFLRADEEFPKDRYGLPPKLYDTEVLIEKTVKVTTNIGLTTQSASFVLPTGTVIVCHRPGSLDGVEGGRSFSTCSVHLYRDDDMKVETDSDKWNRVEKLAITDSFEVTMTAPVTGFLLTNVV